MKEKQNPKIEYRLKEMTLKEAPKAPNAPITFDTIGFLMVAGSSNRINMVVTMERLDKNRLKFSGGTPMKMTDYSVKPPAPTLALGAIKTGDDIKVSFEWMTARKEESASATPK